QEDPFARAQARVEGPAPAAPAAPAPAPAAPARRGPGRPPGAKNKKTLEREASAAVQAAVAARQDPRGVLTAPAAPVAPVARDESRKQEPPAALEGFIIVRGAGIDRLQASALGLAGLVVRNGAEWLHDLTEQVAKAKGAPFYAIPFF